MSKYLKSVVVFGYLPSVLVLILAIVGSYLFLTGQDKLSRSKMKSFESVSQSRSDIALLKEFIAKEGGSEGYLHLDEQIDEDLIQSLSENLSLVLKKYDSDSIQNTSIRRPSGVSPVAGASEGQYSRVSMSFEGYYSAIVETIAEIELRMPQLCLESLSLKQASVGRRESPKLEVEVNYLSWRRPGAS